MELIKNLIPAAIQPNLAPAKHEQSAPASGEEKKFAIAIAEKKIYHSEIEDLKGVLRYCMIIVGLRAQNYPDDIEKQVLLNFIFEHYGGHTAQEIKLAFEMAITRKLDIDAKCYENFSVVYFTSIMEAYREWAREQVKRLPAPELKRTEKEKLYINLDYAAFLLKLINKLPCKI